jgi:hypothetical protein
MRSAILIFLASLAFATTPARAQSAWLERIAGNSHTDNNRQL